MPRRTVLAHASTTTPCPQGTLATLLQVFKHADYKCAKTIEVTFLLSTASPASETTGKWVEVGYAIAYIVDRTAVGKQGKANAPKLWMQELLNSKDDDSELSTIMRTLHTKSGARRAAFKPFAAELAGEKIVHIDTLKLDPEYRGNGRGKLALDAFHSVLPLLSDGLAFSGPVVLSPATPEDAADEYSALSVFEQEGKLISFYEKCGYEVYVRGEEDVEGSTTVMGRVV